MQLSTPRELKQSIPLTENAKQFVQNTRNQIAKIIERQDERLLLVIGPCSIHSYEEGIKYALRLKNLAERTQEDCLIVMRANVEKPRTSGGWQGLINDPYLNGSGDIERGLTLSRSLLVQLAEMEIPAAIEFLSPFLAPYVEDLVSWGWIGARTSSSQLHRVLASFLPMPMGFKNTIDGNIDVAINGVAVSRKPHSFAHINEEGKITQCKSLGNPHTHIVLRGSIHETNYDAVSVQKALDSLRKHELSARLLIDCSHGNAEGHYFKQKEVFEQVLEQIRAGNKQIFGMMIESHLEAGTQKIPAQLGDLQTGISVTDPCLDFSSTEELVSSLGSIKLAHS